MPHINPSFRPFTCDCIAPRSGGDNAFTDPYRLFNLDTFEYLADSEMGIYGSIPFMHAHRAGSTVAIFSVVGSETWVDITKSTSSSLRSGSLSVHTHWMSESGILDLIVFLGPTDEEVFQQYGSLTGMTALPQSFAVGYHQCRWNYLNQEDVAEVSRKFDEHDIPMDVLWLDIEYAEEHKYFIWDRNNFPEPEKMQDDLAAVGRQLVAIVDPHIKRVPELYVYKEAQDLGILSTSADGKTEYEGWCWTGSSSWTDFFNPVSWNWWIGLFKFDKFIVSDSPAANPFARAYPLKPFACHSQGSRPNLFIWNDMNEVSETISQKRAHLHNHDWLTCVPVNPACYFQRTGDDDAEGQYPLRRMGTSRSSQHQRNGLCE